MRRALFAATLWLSAAVAGAQVGTLSVPAGTPEDKALQAITAENDGQKRVAMLQEFLTTFAANPQAVTYGQWQMAQQYLDLGDTAKALDYGQKALAGQGNNLDILVFVAGAAQKAKNTDLVVDCAARGGAAFNGIASLPKPEGMDPDDYLLRIKQAQDPLRDRYEYLEAAAYNALVAEPNSSKRMGYIERYVSAFPDSRFQDQVMQLAVATLGELKDSARLASFSEKALAANPKSVSLLVVLAEAVGESSDPGSGARAEGYARKALEVGKGQTATDANQLTFYVAMAHSSLGYALMKQEKNTAAIPELKLACTQLKAVKDRPEAYPRALYGLSFAYAKTPGHLPEAKSTLTELIAISGPYQQPGRDLLARVQAAANAPAKRASH
ncbi:MAG TPA: hypothetical protein VIX19_06320 [Terriglobales bacterium]